MGNLLYTVFDNEGFSAPTEPREVLCKLLEDGLLDPLFNLGLKLTFGSVEDNYMAGFGRPARENYVARFGKREEVAFGFREFDALGLG